MTGSQPPVPAIENVPDWVGAYVSACIGCGKTDNHPKIQTGPLNAPAVRWHHDCFVLSEQPGWEQIRDVIAGAAGRIGHALRLHLTGQGTDPTKEGK